MLIADASPRAIAHISAACNLPEVAGGGFVSSSFILLCFISRAILLRQRVML